MLSSETISARSCAPLIPGGASSKVVEFWRPTNHKTWMRRLSVVLCIVYKTLIRVAHSCRAVFVFIHRQCVNEGKASAYYILYYILLIRWCLCFTGSGTVDNSFASLANLTHVLRKNKLPFPACMYVCMYVWSSHIAEYGSTG